MTTLDFAPASLARRGVSLLQLHDALWRVTREDGEVLGYLERFETPSGERFRAKRFVARLRTFTPVGEFWRMEDAADCFRFG